jgi:hypothetical protein
MAIEFNDEDFEVSDWRITYGSSSAIEFDIEGEYAFVKEINALPSGCGIGTELCTRFEEMATSAGCKLVEVPASLTSGAICFWLAMGYDVQDKRERRKMNWVIEHDRAPRNDIQGVIVLEKRLA